MNSAAQGRSLLAAFGDINRKLEGVVSRAPSLAMRIREVATAAGRMNLSLAAIGDGAGAAEAKLDAELHAQAKLPEPLQKSRT